MGNAERRDSVACPARSPGSRLAWSASPRPLVGRRDLDRIVSPRCVLSTALSTLVRSVNGSLRRAGDRRRAGDDDRIFRRTGRPSARDHRTCATRCAPTTRLRIRCHFTDEGGNNFWGVQVWEHEGEEYVLASDRDFGCTSSNRSVTRELPSDSREPAPRAPALSCCQVPQALAVDRRLSQDARRRWGPPGSLPGHGDPGARLAKSPGGRLLLDEPDPALVCRVHDAGALASWRVGSAGEAVPAEAAGCDFITAQGNEAGGHIRGTLGLLPLLSEVLEAVSIPVLATGGIRNARGVAAAESNAHPDYVRAVIAAGSEDSVRTTRFEVDCGLCPSTHGVLRSAIGNASSGGARPKRASVPLTRCRTGPGV